MTTGRRARISASPSAIRQVADLLDAFCADQDVPDDVAWRLRVAIDEIVANILAYGSTAGTPPSIEILFCRTGDVVEITVSDDGSAFDPLARPAPDVTSPLAARKPGGLGIALVKALMDDVRYERTTVNVLTIRKQIAPDSTPGQAGTP